MTDASFQAAGYAVLIEDDPNQKYTSTRKTYALIDYGSKTYSPSKIKMSPYAKEFLAIYMAFNEFGHIFWGATKPVIIMTDSKVVTRFFQTKMILHPYGMHVTLFYNLISLLHTSQEKRTVQQISYLD